MVYWLLTHLRPGLWLLPLLCVTLHMPWVAARWWLGSGIRRCGEGASAQILPRLVIHLWCSLVLTVVYSQLAAQVAIQPAAPDSTPVTNPLLHSLTGGPDTINQPLLVLALGGWGLLTILLNLWLGEALRAGGAIREQVDRWRYPAVPRGALGSAHFCTPREFNRFRRPDTDGLPLYGAFWGQADRRLDKPQGILHLSGEDLARGLLVLGGPGSGKTQGLILPALADRMLAGHSLIVADPQGELVSHLEQLAAVTSHLLVVHDPTRTDGPRFNLAADIQTVSEARAIADVLVPAVSGDNRFWSDSASALLSACLLRFANLGAIFAAMHDVKKLARTLSEEQDDATLLASAFIASTHSDGKVAANVIATLGTALTGWAARSVRENTSTCDFDANLMLVRPTVVILTCPGRMRGVYAPYLGATLRKLMMDLDSLGEQHGGPLPVPVGVVLDEFPTLGKLDSLVADVNLVRKRRISILLAAQTKGQFHLIYGRDGTQVLFAGLATQIVYGGCDAETAEFYASASGIAAVVPEHEEEKDHPRQRPLLTVDEVISPARGNCTVLARYVNEGYATQVIFHARLTRFYERHDWQHRLKAAHDIQPLMLERGLDLQLEVEGLAARPGADYAANDAMVDLLQEQLPGVKAVSVVTLVQDLLGAGHEPQQA